MMKQEHGQLADSFMEDVNLIMVLIVLATSANDFFRVKDFLLAKLFSHSPIKLEKIDCICSQSEAALASACMQLC